MAVIDRQAALSAPDSNEAPSARSLLHPVFVRVASLSLLGAWVWALYITASSPPAPNWRGLYAPALLAVGAAVSLRASRRHGPSALILSVAIAATAVVDLSSPTPLAGPWLGMGAVLLIGLLTGPAGATGLLLALVLGGWATGIPAASLWAVVREALIGAVVVLLAGQDVVRTLAQAETSELRAWNQAQEARRRRGEVQQANKALRDAYALLERTNRELEIARREAGETRQLKARFAANISHELRTPLNLILGFSRVMYQTPEVYGAVNWTPELRLDVREIHRASRHLLGMIDDILDLSRIDAQRLPLSLEATDVGTIVTEAVAITRGLLRGSEVMVVANVPPGLPEVMVDRTRIRQVLLNLLSNAVRFTDSGRITVEVRLRQREIELAVEDTGAGIPDKDLASIFDEFSQATPPAASHLGGTGLGLALCRQIVQLHGGHIEVRSQLGSGSRFTLSIPLPSEVGLRSRLSYYAPEGWNPPLPGDRIGASIVVLSADASAARQLARGISDLRVITLPDPGRLSHVVDTEHPSAVVLVRDVLAPSASPTVAEVWDAAGRDDFAVVECEMPLENTIKRHLGVFSYLTKPVRPEDVLSAATDADLSHVLVVDDDHGFCVLMERMITSVRPDARVVTCAGAAEGLEALEAGRFSLLLLDLVMPGASGLDMLRDARARAMLSQTKVVIVSGAPCLEEMARLLPARLHVTAKRTQGDRGWLAGISALARSLAPDYSQPATG